MWNGGLGPHAALPIRIVLPPGVAELPGPHDLGADPVIVPLHEGVVDAAAAAGLPRAGLEHPFVQALPGVAEVQLLGLALTGAEAVE